MPDFIYDGKTYYNPVEFAMDRIGGLWKAPILWRLRKDALRYSQIRRSISHISDKVLSSQLRELEQDGLILREIFAEVPVRTLYSLTDRGQRAIPIVEAIRGYGLWLMVEHKIEADFYLKPES